MRARPAATPGGVYNVDVVASGEADVAFTQGDAAYTAFRQGTPRDPRPHSSLRAGG